MQGKAGLPDFLRETYEKFYAREFRPMVGLAYVLSGDRRAAVGLTQGVFIAALRRWRRFDIDNEPAIWVRRAIVRRAASSWRMAVARRVPLLQYDSASDKVHEVDVEANDAWGLVRGLPVDQSNAVALRFYGGVDVDRIAQVLECSGEAVEELLSEGLSAQPDGTGLSEGALRTAAGAVEERIAEVRILPVGGIRRRSERRRVVVVACGAALALGLYGVPRLIGGEDLPEPVAAGGAESGEVVLANTAAGDDMVVLSDEAAGALSELDWEQVDSTVGWADDAVAAGDILYALSTEPGSNWMRGRPPQAIYSSSDGITWDWQPTGDDVWVTDIDVRGDTLYAVTTAPGMEGGVSGVVMSSTDRGASWDTAELALAGAVAVADVREGGMHTNASVVAGPSGVMAVFTTFQYWEEGEQVVTDAFFSENGETFGEAAAPFTGYVRLVAIEEGFLALEEPRFGGSLLVWSSVDGGEWEALSPPTVEWVRSAGDLGGKTVLVGEGRRGPSVVFSDDGGDTWSEVDLPEVVGSSLGNSWIQAVDVGPHGLVLCVGSEFGVTSVVATDDLSTWSELPLGGSGDADFVEAMWVLNSDDEVVVSIREYVAERSLSWTLVGTKN